MTPTALFLYMLAAAGGLLLIGVAALLVFCAYQVVHLAFLGLAKRAG